MLMRGYRVQLRERQSVALHRDNAKSLYRCDSSLISSISENEFSFQRKRVWTSGWICSGISSKQFSECQDLIKFKDLIFSVVWPAFHEA